MLPIQQAIQRMQRELALLRETSTKQNENIISLERKLGHLDSSIIAFNHSYLLQTM